METMKLINLMKSFSRECRICIEETSEDETTLFWKKANKVVHSEVIKTIEISNIKILQKATNNAKLKFMKDRVMKRVFNLDAIKVGSMIEFTNCKPGEVVSIMGRPIICSLTDHVSQIRLNIRHESGNSFHSYRHDGKSRCDSDNDIVSIDGVKI